VQLFGHAHQIGQGGGLHFLHDAAAVRLNRFFRGTEFRSYLFVEQTRDDTGHDLALTRRETCVSLAEFSHFQSLGMRDSIAWAIARSISSS
jgi:hypothetical protein